MHNFYYKRKVEDDRIVFAITEKETYYQIVRYSMSTQQKDYYSMYLECEYAGRTAWYVEDEYECRGSHLRPFVVHNETLKNYLNGKSCNGLDRILEKYEFDAPIIKFLTVNTVDGYAFWEDGFTVSMTEITKDNEITIYLSSMENAPIKTIKELKLNKNKKIIAGLSIKEPSGDIYLISLNKKYISADGFDKDNYLNECLEIDNARIEIMSDHHYEAEHGFYSTMDKDAKIPMIQILPRIGLLIWEYEEDGIRLKSAPQYIFVDLNDQSNIKENKTEN